MNDAIRTQVSAFVDGELPENEAELLLLRMSQDAALRQQAAEYMAMGRVIRGERVIAGMAQLRDRISAAIDDQPVEFSSVPAATARSRFLRPLAGVGIAATVALAAILGMRQIGNEPALDELPVADTAADPGAGAFTVPAREDDQLQEYLRRHAESASFIGAGSINARLVTLELTNGDLIEIDPRPATGLEETPEAENDVEAEGP